MIEPWRDCWRRGFVPILTEPELGALAGALECDDEALMQGQTVSPPPFAGLIHMTAEGACALGYCGWKGAGLVTVSEVEEFFARACYEADERLGEPGQCRYFLNWFDETPRDKMRPALLEEVRLALDQRRAQCATP